MIKLLYTDLIWFKEYNLKAFLFKQYLQTTARIYHNNKVTLKQITAPFNPTISGHLIKPRVNSIKV